MEIVALRAPRQDRRRKLMLQNEANFPKKTNENRRKTKPKRTRYEANEGGKRSRFWQKVPMINANYEKGGAISVSYIVRAAYDAPAIFSPRSMNFVARARPGRRRAAGKVTVRWFRDCWWRFPGSR